MALSQFSVTGNSLCLFKGGKEKKWKRNPEILKELRF